MGGCFIGHQSQDFAQVMLPCLKAAGLDPALGPRLHRISAEPDLAWPVIGLAMFAANISTVHLVSLAEAAYKYGLVFGNFEWMGKRELSSEKPVMRWAMKSITNQ